MADVLFIGPLMVWGAATSDGHPVARAALAITGLLTVIYNANNYLRRG
ncbi:MAG: hypothetical protein GY906_38565 [bacterium]|nr:hypothetical protein [bacterium]